MIRHIYLFRLKEKERLLEAVRLLNSLKEHIPYLAGLEVGVDFKGDKNSYELCELVSFRTREDFERFKDDPYHARVRSYMDEVRETGVKIDYEIDP